MFHMTHAIRTAIRKFQLPFITFSLIPQILIPFLIGLFGGSVVGLFSAAPQTLLSSVGLLSEYAAKGTFLSTFWRAFRFIFACGLLAVWIPGFLLIPILSALRAFVFACSVAALIRPYSSDALSFAFISFGIPSLLELPGFLIASTEAFQFSRQLACSKRISGRSERRIQLHKHFVLILLFCIADAAYMHFLLPLLTRFLS